MKLRTPYISLGCLFLLAVASVMAMSVKDYGISWDEVFRWSGGESKYRYYEAMLSGDWERASALRNRTDHYPGFFDLPLATLRDHSSTQDYLLGHSWCAFFGLLGIAGAMALAYNMGGAPAALLAGIFLALYPRYWGHAFINPKDIPFAATYVWGVWALARVLQDNRRDWRSALTFGFLAGACMAVRVGGLLLLCYAGLFLVVQLLTGWFRFGVLTFRRELMQCIGWLMMATAVAFLILLIFWPAAHQNPFSTAVGTIGEVSHFGWQGEVLYDGKQYAASDLPFHYAPTMIARTAPDLWWWLALSASILLLTRVSTWYTLWRDHRASLLTVFAILFPLAYILIAQSTVYDGVRHLLFIIPPSAALLGALPTAIITQLRKKYGRPIAWSWAVPCIGLALWTAIDMIRLHPYQYIYYNHMSGGVSEANGRYETDYWGTAFREATEVLAANLPARSEPWRLTMEPPLDELQARFGKPVIPPPALVKPFLGDNIVLVRSHQQPDFYIASTRNGYNDMREGDVMVAIKRDGVTLVEVKEFLPSPANDRD